MPESSIPKAVKQMSGFDDIDNLRAAMPTNIDDGQSAPKKGRKPRSATTPPKPAPTKSNMDDPRYAEACAEMAAFGGKGIIIRGFDAGAVALDDPTFKLNTAEQRQWDNFFYVLSKKPIFDVGSAWFLALFFIVTLAAQLGWRVFERTEIPILQELFPNAERRAEMEREKEAARTYEQTAGA